MVCVHFDCSNLYLNYFEMRKQAILLLIGFMISLFALNAQVQIKNYHFTYHKINCEDNESQEMDFTYPDFFAKSGLPLTEINDSVKAIVLEQYWNEGTYLTDFIASKSDMTINLGDSLRDPDCSPLPEEGFINYTVLINNDQLLSFKITSSFHAGGGGNGSLNLIYPLCFDVKENKWVDLKVIFPANFNLLQVLKADSFHSDEIGRETFNELSDFTGGVEIREGSLVFFYVNQWRTYWYEEISIPYEEYEKYLLPQYRKLLKPAAPKPALQKH